MKMMVVLGVMILQDAGKIENFKKLLLAFGLHSSAKDSVLTGYRFLRFRRVKVTSWTPVTSATSEVSHTSAEQPRSLFGHERPVDSFA